MIREGRTGWDGKFLAGAVLTWSAVAAMAVNTAAVRFSYDQRLLGLAAWVAGTLMLGRGARFQAWVFLTLLGVTALLEMAGFPESAERAALWAFLVLVVAFVGRVLAWRKGES